MPGSDFSQFCSPHPALEKLLHESAKRVAAMTAEEREEMVRQQCKPAPVTPEESAHCREHGARPMQFAERTKTAEAIAELSAKIDKLAQEKCARQGLAHEFGGTVHNTSDRNRLFKFPRPDIQMTSFMPRPLRSLDEVLADLRLQRAQDDGPFAIEFEEEDDLSCFSPGPILADIIEEALGRYEPDAQTTKNRHGSGGSYNPNKGVIGCETPEVPRILLVVSSEDEVFRLANVVNPDRYHVIRPFSALSRAEKFMPIICSLHALDLNKPHAALFELHTWLNDLQHHTVSGNAADVIYL